MTVPTPRLNPLVDLQVVELYPYIEYIKYLLAGSIAMSIFIVAMIGGGITFIDDKSRGLHEGYLVTPIKKSELILGLIFSGAIKGLMAGTTITIIGGLIAGIDRLWDPVRLIYLGVVLATTSVAMISFMFLLMVRVSDPLVPRAIFGVLNTLLYFPSGAIYPVEGFPVWLRWISYIDPFTYAVHALKALLLKNAGFAAIYSDVLDPGWIFCCAGQSVCRIFQEADIRCREEIPFMGILDSGAEEPKSKALRYVISASRAGHIDRRGPVVFPALHAGKTHGRAVHGRGRRGRYAAGLPNLAPAPELFLSGFPRFLGAERLLQSRSRVTGSKAPKCRRRAAAEWWSPSKSARTPRFPSPRKR